MSVPTFRVALRLRTGMALSAAFGLVVVITMVGALYPSIGHEIGHLDVPKGVAQLLGGADYGTAAGWFRSEIAVIYAPLVAGAVAIVGAGGASAGEEEAGITALIAAYPVKRSALVFAKGAAVAVAVVITALGVWVGLLIGVALAGGGVSLGQISSLAVQLVAFGWACGGLALGLGAATGRHGFASGIATGIVLAGWLVNGFAPLVGSISWLKYFTLFYYFAGHGLLGGGGVWLVGVLVLVAFALVVSWIGASLFERRDLVA